MKMNRKGQAAMEFLMTYGWAILIVVIAIAALAAFGVFNRPVQEGCFMESATMACQAAIPAVSETAADSRIALVQLGLRNGGAARINITDIQPSDALNSICGADPAYEVRETDQTVIGSRALGTGASVARNQAFVLRITCGADSYEANSNFIETFNIVYDDTEGGIEGVVARVRAVAKT